MKQTVNDDLQSFIEKVEQGGNIVHLGGQNILYPNSLDTALKLMDRQGAYNENIIYASPAFTEMVKNMLRTLNAGVDTYGSYIKEGYSALAFLPEISFWRGSYEFHVITKDIKGAVIIPTAVLQEESLIRNSVVIKE